MLIYEVNLEVDEEVKFSVAGWLTEHIQKMLDFKGFKVAYWFFRQPEDEGLDATTKTLWTIQYVVESRASVDDFISHSAEGIRKEMTEKFGDKYKYSRRVLHLLSVAGLPVEGNSQAP